MCSLNNNSDCRTPLHPLASLSRMIPKLDCSEPKVAPSYTPQKVDFPGTQPRYECPPPRTTTECAGSIPGHACKDKDSVLLEDKPGTTSRMASEHGCFATRTSPAGDHFFGGPQKTHSKALTKRDLPSRTMPEDVILGMDFEDEGSMSSTDDAPQGNLGRACGRVPEAGDEILGMALEDKDTGPEEESSILCKVRTRGRAPRNPSTRKATKGDASVGDGTTTLERNCYLYRVASKYFDRFRTPVHLAFPRMAPDPAECSPDDLQDSPGVVHECHLCPFSTKFKRDLIQHVWSHTGEKPYKCSTCDYSARSISHLVVHQRTHTGEKPYKCGECSYATIRKSYLVIHQRKHTGERPFKCLFCSYATAAKWRLMVHLRTHTGERPYKCQFCDYTAAQKGNLMVHERSHTVLPA